VVKLDIEGAEWDVMEKLLKTAREDPSILDAVDIYSAEVHSRNPKRIILEEEWNASPFPTSELNDEQFADDPHPLPPRLHAAANETDPWSTLSVKANGAFWREPGFWAKSGTHQHNRNHQHQHHDQHRH
jgi:hypothetical protein